MLRLFLALALLVAAVVPAAANIAELNGWISQADYTSQGGRLSFRMKIYASGDAPLLNPVVARNGAPLVFSRAFTRLDEDTALTGGAGFAAYWTITAVVPIVQAGDVLTVTVGDTAGGVRSRDFVCESPLSPLGVVCN